MNGKSWLFIGFTFALAVAAVCFLMTRHRPEPLKIFHTMRPSGYAMRTRRIAAPALSFGFEGRLRLTEIKVVPLAAWQTNHHAPAVWHLISDSNSVPTDGFAYGQRIRGMKPAIQGTTPGPLATNTIYRLFVSAGGLEGQHDFSIQ